MTKEQEPIWSKTMLRALKEIRGMSDQELKEQDRLITPEKLKYLQEQTATQNETIH